MQRAMVSAAVGSARGLRWQAAAAGARIAVARRCRAGQQQHSWISDRAGSWTPRSSARASAVDTHQTDAAAASLQGGDIVEILKARGLIDAVTNETLLQQAAQAGPLKVYCGFDPTADSLHMGNLLGIVVLSWFSRCGHTPIALLGGATARVGDPSGKSAERPLLSDAAIEENVAGIRSILQRLLGPQVEIVNNLDWFGSMTLLGFLRDVGKNARIGTMIAKESVKRRLDSESGLSFTEFSYQLLQGFDFAHLYRERGVQVQIGGSDQWGNITAGTDLIRRFNARSATDGEGEDEPDQAFGLTFPLLVKSDGSKFGKSESGALWLSPDKFSPYKMYQYLINVADTDAPGLLRRLTFVPLDQVEQLEKASAESAGAMQLRLAREIVRFVHGEGGVQQAEKATALLKPGKMQRVEGDADVWEELARGGDVPAALLPKSSVVGQPFADLMASSGMTESKSAARRLIKGGGASYNGIKITDELQVVSDDCIVEGRVIVMASGKKNKMVILLE